MEKLILECVVRSVLVALCTAIALYILRVKAARVRHTVWAGVVVLMLILPVWTAWGPKAILRILTPESAVTNVQPAIADIVETSQHVVIAPPAPQHIVRTWRDYLIPVYLLGLSVLLVRLATGTVRSLKLTSDSCGTPLTVGWLRPAVILPANSVDWSLSQMAAVLAHENEHARRRDPLVQWLALLNRAVFWFHPLAWWLSRRLSALAEEACDDAVLAGGHDPIQYSECLLELARSVRYRSIRVSAVGMAMPGTFLPQRIRRIVAGVPMQRISRARMVCMAVVCAAVSTVFTAGAIGYYDQRDQAIRPSVNIAPPPDISLPAPVAPVQNRAKIVLAQTQTRPAAPAAVSTAQSLSGTVIDPSGAVVLNAPVILTNTITGMALTTTTNISGYQFPNIQPGTYNVTVRAPGFEAMTQSRIAVSAGEPHDAGEMFLQLGSAAMSITITGSRTAVAPVVSTTPPSDRTFQGSLTVRTETPKGLEITTPGPLTTLIPFTESRSNFSFCIADCPVGPTRAGGNVQQARILSQVKPLYPVHLQQQGIAGTVRIEAVIGVLGLLANPRAASNVDPALTQIALDAVRQWRYQPTLLNGKPVETRTLIDINFQLTD